MALVPLSTQAVIANGVLAAGAKLVAYDAGTNTVRTLYRTRSLDATKVHPSPVVASDGTWPVMYAGIGDYDVRVLDRFGQQIHFYEDLPGDVAAAGGATFDPKRQIQTGTVVRFYCTGRVDGYVRLNGGTIGNGMADASERANDDCHDAFVFLYNQDANLAVSGGRSAQGAEADWQAGKTITLPNYAKRASVTVGTGYALGATGGEETHALSVAEMPTHAHGASGSSGAAGGFTPSGSIDAVPDHTHPINYAQQNAYAVGGAGATITVGENSPNRTGYTQPAGGHTPVFRGTPVDPHVHPINFTINTTGGSGAHNNMQPYIADSAYLKL